MVPADKLEYFRLRGYKFLFCHSVEPLFYLHLVHGSLVNNQVFRVFLLQIYSPTFLLYLFIYARIFYVVIDESGR
jgi:hypothetical protein